MRQLSIYIPLFLFTLQINAQELKLNWVKHIGGMTDDKIYASTIDKDSNIIATGYFTGTADFDPGPGIVNLTSNGSNDVYIVKTTSNGNLIWAKSFGGSSVDEANAIQTDLNGNIYLTGSYVGTVDFDPNGGVFNLTSSGIQDAFVCKLNSSGNFIWAKSMGGVNQDIGHAITINVNSHLIITGNFGEPGDFDPGPSVFTLTPAGGVGHDIFICSLDSSGNFNWAKRMGGTLADYPLAITTDNTGNIYSTGYFMGTADFDPGATTFNLIANGMQDIYVSKLNSSGNFVWAKQMGGTSDERGLSIAIDNSGNVLIDGVFEAVADFDPGIATFNLSPMHFGRNKFICRLSNSGNFLWATVVGGNISDPWHGATIDQANDGKIYCIGDFGGGTYDFDPGSGVTNLTTGFATSYVSVFDSLGNFIVAANIPEGLSWKAGYTIRALNDRDFLITGFFKNGSDFDPTTDTTFITSNGVEDGFIAKMHFCWAKYNTIYSTTCDNIVSPSGNYIWNSTGTYYDTLITSEGCDSIITINLTVATNSSNVNINSCFNYISPSGNYTWDTSGTYLDTIPNFYGCDSVITINLTVNSVDTSIINNDTSLSAVQNTGIYQWLDCSNSYAPIAGEIGQNFIPLSNGIYSLSISENGCTDTSGCYTISSLSILNSTSPELLSIYPNPFGEKIFIDFNNTIREAEVSIQDITGKKHFLEFEKSTTIQQLILNTEEWENGVYLFKIESETVTVVRKLIKN